MNVLQHLAVSTLFVLLLSSCRKFVTLAPPAGSPDSRALFQSEVSARGVLSGVYSEMTQSGVFSSSLATLYGGLAADELYPYSPGLLEELSRNSITPAAHSLLSTGVWQPAYRFIYTANTALERLPGASRVPDSIKRQLMGEAYFIRAFCYAQLVHSFGGVPLVVSTDYRTSGQQPRSPEADAYKLILEDLARAEKDLPPITVAHERNRPAREAATALKARIHLYVKQWKEAAESASQVIGSGAFELAAHPQEVFVKGSPETIFFLEVPSQRRMNAEAAAVLPLTEETLPTYLIRGELLAAFEAGDRRKEAWCGERIYRGRTLYYEAKYRGSSPTRDESDYVVLRLAELYLVRAEALLQLGDIIGARQDLSVLRERAGLPPVTANDPSTLARAIEQERRVELAFEWGHRWNDLRRRGRAEAVIGALKGADWQPSDTLWPVPIDQIRLNPSLTQNPGY